ncbi:MAG TPA: hypothetical protein VKH19_20085 [Gemmatimonadaceae bacterium]|nr:hypothetical protein [Gemmatimonadaceae bacterium]
MIDRMPYHVEVGGRIATIYVVGRLNLAAAELLLQQASDLPAHVEVLSLHVPQMDLLTSNAGQLIGQLRREWVATRKGPFRLTLSALDAPFGEAFIESAQP